MSYSQSGQPRSDPYGQSAPAHPPLSANDPYHQPGAPRPQWQQTPGYPGYGYPGVVDPYYPSNPGPSDQGDDDDDEPQRRFGKTWLVAIAVVVVALVIGVAVARSSDGQHGHITAPAKRPVALTEQWRSGAPVSMWSATLASQTLVAIECNQRAGPHADAAECALRGRSLSDGQQRWELTGQPLGMTVTTVGEVVVVSGDGLHGSLRDNNAGNEQAHRHTLMVNAQDGRVIKAFDGQVAWMRSHRTLVLRDLPAEGGRQTFTAVDVTSGERRWSFDNARPADEGVNELAALLPDGAAPTTLSDATVAVMDGATTTVARELDTGKDLISVPHGSQDPTRYLSYLDDTAVRVVSGSNIRLEGVSAGNLTTAAWSIELGADAIARQCSTMICVSNSQGLATRLVNPKTGKVVATNDRGAMYVRRSGDVVALLRCDSGGSFVNPCPLDKARTEAIDVKTGRQLWQGKAPVFMLSYSVDGEEKLLIATASPGSDSTQVTAISTNTRPVEWGALERPGLVRAAEVQTEPVADGYEPSFLPTRICAVDKQQLVCGTRWQLNQVVSWRPPS